MSAALNSTGGQKYGSMCEKEVNGYTYDDYLIEIDDKGEVTKFYYSDFDETKSLKYEGKGLKLEEIDGLLGDYDEDLDFSCE